MGVHVLKQLCEDIKESADNAGRHLHVGMPSLFKKHSKRIHKMREEFKQMDRDGAKVANAEAKKTFRDKPYDLKKDRHPEGAGDEHFRDHVMDGILDNAGKAFKDLKTQGEFEDRVRNAGKELVRGLKNHKVKLQLMRTYMLALKGEFEDKGKGVLVDSAAAALYAVYIDGTPAEDAVPFDSDNDDDLTFKKMVGAGVDMAENTKEIKPIDGHAF